MTTATKTIAKPACTFTGKGAHARTTALLQVAALAFNEEQSRSAVISNLRVVLGKSPTEAQVKAAKVETTIGYVASRLPVSELPRGKTEAVDRLEHARAIVCTMARAPEKGKALRPLRNGQTGRRSATQQRIMRNAEQRTSQLFAELELSGAQTVAAKNAKAATRAPSMAGSGKGKKGEQPAAPEHATLVKPSAPVSSDDYVQHMQVQLAALVAFDAKHAKKRPTTHGEFAELLGKLKQAANKAANEYQVRKAKAEAEAR